MHDDVGWIEVEVVYARPNIQTVIPVTVRRGTILMSVVQECGILAQHREIDLGDVKFGIFGRPAERTTEVKQGDRIEIYRPLHADAQQARKARALKQGQRTP